MVIITLLLVQTYAVKQNRAHDARSELCAKYKNKFILDVLRLRALKLTLRMSIALDAN